MTITIKRLLNDNDANYIHKRVLKTDALLAPSTLDTRDWIYESMITDIDRKIYLPVISLIQTRRAKLRLIVNDKHIVSPSIVGTFTMLIIRDLQHKKYKEISNLFVYHKLIKICSHKIELRTLLRVLYYIGIPNNNFVNVNKFDSIEAHTSAAKNRIAGYARVLTLEACKQALYENNPCLILYPRGMTTILKGKVKLEIDSAPSDAANVSYNCALMFGYDGTGFYFRTAYDEIHILEYNNWGALVECWVVFYDKRKEKDRCLIS